MRMELTMVTRKLYEEAKGGSCREFTAHSQGMHSVMQEIALCSECKGGESVWECARSCRRVCSTFGGVWWRGSVGEVEEARWVRSKGRGGRWVRWIWMFWYGVGLPNLGC